MFRLLNPPREPWKYVVIYAQILETCWWWNIGHLHTTEDNNKRAWHWPDAGIFEPNKYVHPIRYSTANTYGIASLDENIPKHLVQAASDLCPFLGVRVEMLFKELGLYEATP